MLRPPWAPPAVYEECSHCGSCSILTVAGRKFGQLQFHFPGRLQSHREVAVSHRGGADPDPATVIPASGADPPGDGVKWAGECVHLKDPSTLRVRGGCRDVNRAQCSCSRVRGSPGAELPWQVGAWARGGGQCPGGMESRSVCGPGASILSGNRLRMTKMEGETERAESLGCDGQGQG